MSQTDVRTEVEVHCLEMDKKQLNDLVSVYFWKLTLETLIILIRNGEASGMQKKKKRNPVRKGQKTKQEHLRTETEKLHFSRS